MCSRLHLLLSGPSFKHFATYIFKWFGFHSVGKGRISCCSFYLLNEIEYRCGYYIVTTQLVAVESEMQGEDFVNNDPF